LVALVSDNGPARGSNYLKGWRKDWPKETLLGSADPLSGHKAQRLEGGIRVPFILRWPARLKPGQVYERPVSSLDLYPTFCAATGAQVPDGTRLDGVNLLPHLSGEDSADPHDMLFWKPHAGGAVRHKQWKLLIESWGKGKVRLFDLENDLAETNDLAGEKPELTEQLHQAWLEWSKPFPIAASKKSKGRK
jgi:arylsulfatase A-like enzyme